MINKGDIVLSDIEKKNLRFSSIRDLIKLCEEKRNKRLRDIEVLEGDEDSEWKIGLEKAGEKEYQLLYFHEKKKIYEEIIEHLENYETAINQPEIERHLGLNKNWTFEIVLAIIIFLLIFLTRR